MMKFSLFVCVIFVLVACYSCSPVAKENELVNGLQKAVESQKRARRSVDILSEITSVLEEVPNTRNKRSNDALLKSLAQFQEKDIASDDVAKAIASNFIDKFEEK